MGAFSRAKKMAKGLGDASKVADNPLSMQMAGAAGATVLGTYAASSFRSSVSERTSSTVPGATHPVSAITETASSVARGAAVGMGLPSSQQPSGVGLGSTLGGPATMIGGAAGIAAGAYQAKGTNTVGQSIDKMFSGSIAKPGKASTRFGGDWWKRQGKRAMNLGNKAMGKMGYAAIGTFVAAATAATVNRTIERTAQKVLAAGTPGTKIKSDNALAQRKRTKRGTQGVSRYAGRQSDNVMSGSTVLALHKTGGSGGVLR